MQWRLKLPVLLSVIFMKIGKVVRSKIIYTNMARLITLATSGQQQKRKINAKSQYIICGCYVNYTMRCAEHLLLYIQSRHRTRKIYLISVMDHEMH